MWPERNPRPRGPPRSTPSPNPGLTAGEPEDPMLHLNLADVRERDEMDRRHPGASAAVLTPGLRPVSQPDGRMPRERPLAL